MKYFILILIIFTFYQAKSQSNNLVNTEWQLISINDKTENKTFVFSNAISVLFIKDSVMYMNTCNSLQCNYKDSYKSKKIKCSTLAKTKINCFGDFLVIEKYYSTHFYNLNYSKKSDTLELNDNSAYFKYVRKK